MTDKEKLERIKVKVKEFRQRWYAINTDFAAGQKGALTDVIAFIDSLQEEPNCIYNHSLEERQRFCKYCSAACQARIKEEPKDKCKGCNNVKGCITCIDGSEWAHYHYDEEPVSKDYRERYKRIAQSEEFKKTHEGMSVGEIMHVEGEKPVWIKELQDKLDSLSQEDFEKVWSKYSQYGKGEEPVSEDLEEACDSYYDETWDEHGGRAMVVDGCHDIWFPSHATDDFFKAGAKWQAEQFEKNRLKHCNSITNEQAELEQGFIDQHIDKHQRMPTFLDAIEYGMRLQKEQDREHPDKESFAKRLKLEKEEWEDEYRQQMMEDAFECEVKVDAGGYPYIPQMELYDYDKDIPLAKEGDRYKVILIKEDKL